MKLEHSTDYFAIVSKSRKAYAKFLEPVCKKWELTRNELDVMLFLNNNPEYNRASDIVLHRGMVKSHVSMSVASLEGQGLLERSFSETDRRTALLKLTSQGLRIAVEAAEVQGRFFQLLFNGISDKQFLEMARISQQIYENIQQINEV